MQVYKSNTLNKNHFKPYKTILFIDLYVNSSVYLHKPINKNKR